MTNNLGDRTRRSSRADLARKRLGDSQRPMAIALTLRPMTHPNNSEAPIPSKLVLLRPNPADRSKDQLYLDRIPMPPDSWRYDAHDRTLSWHGAFGGGHLHLSHDGLGGTGNVGHALAAVSVWASATAAFDCDVALDCGASYVTSGNAVVGLAWDPASPSWKAASWDRQRLRLSYTVTPGGPITPPSLTFEFADQKTGSVPWDPDPGSAASLEIGNQGAQIVWNVMFQSSGPPDPDTPPPTTGPNTVYPWWMQATEDAATQSITGVLVIDQTAPSGTLVGMSGVRESPLVNGYFRTGVTSAPFGVFDGKLVVGDVAVKDSRLHGQVLSWTGLSGEHQQRTGLPASGRLVFQGDGSVAPVSAGTVAAHRLPATAALKAIADHRDLHPETAAHVDALQETLASGGLDIIGLLAMTPYAQDDKGGWSDAVQTSVTQGLSDIMNKSIPPDLWNLLFPGASQPTLSGELAVIASTPVPGVPSPADWYQTLATAVLTQGLADGTDDNCKYMNGPRAAAWLKTQMANSKVYQTHGQALFQYQWQQRFPLIAQYVSDQVTNAAVYQPQITQQVAKVVADITQNVAVDPTQSDVKNDLIKQVQDAGQYAIDNNLYWAFGVYTYTTAPAILANIAQQMGVNTGSQDGTTLARLFQANVSILTALDPSGTFASRYTTAINTFLATNIVPSMFSFDTSDDFDLIRDYLQQFVNANIKNEDQQIAQAAANIGTILADADAATILKASLNALRAAANATQQILALPYIANGFVKWFAATYPRFSTFADYFGSVLIGGVTALSAMNLILQFKSWDKMNDEQKAQVITNATQLGLQIFAAVVKRGVRIYNIYSVEGLSEAQRSAAIGKIIINGEGGEVENALARTGNTAAKWLGSTQGIDEIEVSVDGAVGAVMVNDAAAVDVDWLTKVFGKNLDEFMATRAGPIFILAGIGYSIYSIATGDSGYALIGDTLGIVSGGLTLLAMVGGWAITAGLVAAEGVLATVISAAGPLGILAALAGVGILIYQMFQKPPDPIHEFVDNYVRPAGLAVRNKESSIDYVGPYTNASGLLMVGATFAANGATLTCAADGSLGLSGGSSLPNCVWQVVTDGLGLSEIFTLAQPDSTKPPVVLYLSLMSDNTVSFQQKPVPPPATNSSRARAEAPSGTTVVTQIWLSDAVSDAQLSSNGHLESIDLTLRAVLPDAKQNYTPSQAQGYLSLSGGTVLYGGLAGAFTLRMSGMAPNYMTMSDIHFVLGSIPSQAQKYGPRFGVFPSTMSFQLNGTLPDFLTFDSKLGSFAPNGGQASTATTLKDTLVATNPLGQAQVDFTIAVAGATG